MMGYFANRLAQRGLHSLAGKSILQASSKTNLARSLDSIFKTDPTLSAAASLADPARYARFTIAMHAVYSTMEAELDKAAPGSAARAIWDRHSDVLRRSQALAADLADVGVLVAPSCTISPARVADSRITNCTRAYVASIKIAGAEDGGAGLIGHFYCRFVGDLIRGERFSPQSALGLPSPPRHYNFEVGPGGRGRYLESVYESIESAGVALSPQEFDAVVAAARSAFEHNAMVCSEEPVTLDAARGVLNVFRGYASSKMSSLGVRQSLQM